VLRFHFVSVTALDLCL